MISKNLAIPMRAQPFHSGHQNYISVLSKNCTRGVILLCRDYDFSNPFPLPLRTKWVNDFLNKSGINNIVVAKRSSLEVSRRNEYSAIFRGEDFLIMTTNETDAIYKSLGFTTFNHHDPNNNFWSHSKDKLILNGTGSLIRERLRRGFNCFQYLDYQVEVEAKRIIMNEDFP